MTEAITVDRDPLDAVAGYRRRMFSPLSGIVTAVGFSLRSRTGPRVAVAGGELTGVHELLGKPAARTGSHHIGGSGVTAFEPGIRVFAEAAERYAGELAALDPQFRVRRASHHDLTQAGQPVLAAEKLRYVDGRRPSPYQPFDPEAQMGWIQVANVGAGPPQVWIPAQQFLVGYTVRRHEEPWLQAAVSTGTAVHTSYPRALLAAAYEIVQIDAAMGHWYGAGAATVIKHDERTTRLQRVLARACPPHGYTLSFHYLPNADLPDFTVACVLREPQGRVPVVAVGLGADHQLETAMYKAWLEATGVRALAEWGAVDRHLDGQPPVTDPATLLDLDANVAHYAASPHDRTIAQRFTDTDQRPATQLPPDVVAEPERQAKTLLRAFADTGKQVFAADITQADIRQLGFCAVRLWSPDTLSLCLPGAPPYAHPRFGAYGGFANPAPHPYP